MSKHRTRTTKWNRLLSGVLCLALVLGLLPATGLVQIAEAAHWAAPDGERLVEWGVMKPSSDLRLSDTITRAEIVTMLNRAFGYSQMKGTPFTDVFKSDWYAEDIDIAYTAGYFKGTAPNTASPMSPLTREEAAVLLARCMRLQETVGENLDFTDSHALNDWSRGLVGAAAAEGVIKGLPDGSFSPANNITRGEVATMLVRAIGNPVSTEGVHELGDVYGNVTINCSGVTLRDTVILGNLYLTGGVDLGNVLLENVTVLGRIIISGGGESHEGRSSVVLRNVTANELAVDSMVDQNVTISAYGLTDIPATYVRSNAYLEDACTAPYGLQYIELAGKRDVKLQLAGSIKEVKNKTPFSRLQLVQGTAEKITIDEYATHSELLIDINTVVKELNLDVATRVYGRGDIIDLKIMADGCEVEILPEHVYVRPGLSATLVDGDVRRDIGSTEASELSSDPRILSGYPSVDGLRPTQAEGLYAANKPGTIYWAVSAVADGSVSVKDLINNPAYGGNIIKDGEIPQSGSIDATTARREYDRLISGLEPDGSYYISAVMVDERGNYSPLKVFSFRTPDDTLPAFVEDPSMTLVTCDTAQVTAMANKSCRLYWVLLPAGAVAPTPSNFKSGSGSLGGHYGYGSQSVVKNVPVSIKVNDYRLEEKTDYDLYLWLEDFDGAMSSAVVHVNPPSPSFTTPDETDPIITSLMQTDYGVADAQVSFTVSETPVTLYWAVVEDSKELIPAGTDMGSLQAQILVKTGSATSIRAKGSKDVGGDVQDTYYIEPADFMAALDYTKYGTHSFKFYCVAEDADGNLSEVRVITIRTLDTDPPHVWLEFVNALNGNPRVDSDIKIVFDEEVQGGAGAENTFLELYERVESYEKGGEGYKAELTSARNALAKELAAHFQLWSTPKSGTAQQMTAKGDNQTNSNWVIDWHQATVTKESGNLVIFIPNSALNLESGASYQFRLYDVCDLAIDHNAMAVGDDGVTCVPKGGKASTSNSSTNSNVLPRVSFTTVYAQVEMRDKTGYVTEIHYQNSTESKPYEGYRLDIVVDLVPEDTSKVPLTEVWDLIMWSDSIMQVDVYRKVLKDDGKDGADIPGQDWEKVSKDSDTIRFNSVGEGRGLSANKPVEEYDVVNGSTSDDLDVGLKKGYIYRYGVHITHLDTDEEDPTKTPQDWDQLVVMRFSVVAGLQRDVQVVSRGVDRYYEEYKEKSDGITEIGVWNTDTAQESKIRCEWPFVDSRAPSFGSAYPAFKDVGPNSFNIQVSLNRKGTIHYTVAPVGSITTSIDPTTQIDSSNDGTGRNKNWITKLTKSTYIPVDGSDRETYKQYIYFMNKDITETDPDKFVPGEYGQKGNPDYLAIKNKTYANLADVLTGSFEVTAGNAVETIPIGGLKADTWYYVYVVLEGVGATDYAVQIYRVKTDEARTPTIGITSDYTSATMTPDSYVRLDYMLVSSTALPSYFNTKIECRDGNTRTALEAMLNRPGGSTYGQKTFFDLDAPETLKTSVMNYLLSPNRSSATGVIYAKTVTYDPATTQTDGVFEDFDKVLPEYKEGQENVNTYVLLAVAVNYSLIHPTNNAGPTDYGFAAADGLYHQDLSAPELTGVHEYKSENGTTLNLSVSITKVTNSTNGRDATSKWGDGSSYTETQIKSLLTFTGSVTISFTVPIYQVVRGDTNTHPILTHEYNAETTCKNHAKETGGVCFMDLISYSGKSAEDEKGNYKLKLEMNESFQKNQGAQRSFRLDFENIMDGFEITFLTQGNIMGSNPAGYIFPYEVTLKFDPLITNQELGVGYLDQVVGGFRVTLREARQ